jgi:cytochrome c553
MESLMMRSRFVSFAACAVVILACVPARADIAAGKAKAELCVGCHGENGIAEMENMPSLAGQPDQFIQWQLVYFRAGTRKNEQMQPIVEQLSNEDIRNLGAYFASLPLPKNEKADDDPELSKKGAQSAAGRRCASCHLDDYAGTKGVARLAGQREDYLLKALRDYKSGQRSGAQAAMAEVAFSLHEEEIVALSHYLANLK